MSDALISYLLSGLVFAVAAYLAYIFLGEYTEAAADFKERQMSTGDNSLAELYIGISPGALLAIQSFIAVIVFAALSPLMGIFFSALLGAAAFFLPRLYLGRLKEKRVRQIETQLVDALELLGNSLKLKFIKSIKIFAP